MNQIPEEPPVKAEIIEENGGDNKIGKIEDSKFGKLKYTSIVKEMQKSYLDYAMSVIVARALPDVRDGLKPVHRRILYSMYKSGIHHSSAYKKSARIVGDVLGKYHPHGDSSVYMALVRLAQNFSMRYPLVDGQGNFGSIDGDSPAAMRYTEARLAKISQELLNDLDKNTVNLIENFDGSLQEPTVLPSKLPNLLLMGSEGIAVGMATKIPPHNLVEVCQAIIKMIQLGSSELSSSETNKETEVEVEIEDLDAASKQDKKALAIAEEITKDNEQIDLILASEPSKLAGHFTSEITFEEIAEFIKGPDFPTGGIIYNQRKIQEAYQTGKGKIIVRAKAEIEERSKGFEIVVTEIPYQVNKARLLMQIADLVKNKKIIGIKNLRDDSDRKGLQITVELKRDAKPKLVLNKLFKYSYLQSSFPMNMVALNSEGIPQLMNIKQILREYIVHRQFVVVRRSQYELQAARDRAHILEGLLIALAHLDDVIETIRRSSDTETAHDRLMSKFNLSDVQATAILEMQLKRLAALERKKIEEEYEEIKKVIKKLLSLLTHPSKILQLITDETNEMMTLYGDERLTKVIKGKVGEFSEEDLIANERVVITLTESGYIKRLSPNSFRSQSRGGKGSKGMSMKKEDVVLAMMSANTHDNLLFFTNFGRAFPLRAFEIPPANRQSKGKAIVNLLALQNGEKVESILAYDLETQGKDHFIVLVTKKGLIKKTALSEFDNIKTNGIIAIKLAKDDELVWSKLSTGQDEVMVVTRNGQCIRFKEKEVRPAHRNTKGVRSITLRKDDFVVGVDNINQTILADNKAGLMIITDNGIGKRSKIEEYPLQKRAGIGVKVSKIAKKTGLIAAAKLITSEHDEVVITTKEGLAIKFDISKKSVPFFARATQGVILMKLNQNDQVVAAALTYKEDQVLGEGSSNIALASEEESEEERVDEEADDNTSIDETEE